jgi:hypothetical protein
MTGEEDETEEDARPFQRDTAVRGEVVEVVVELFDHGCGRAGVWRGFMGSARARRESVISEAGGGTRLGQAWYVWGSGG